METMKKLSLSLLLIFFITLASGLEMNITSNDSWYVNQGSIVRAEFYSGGILLDPDSIIFNITPETNYEESSLIKKDTGIYEKYFTINSTNFSELTITITAYSRGSVYFSNKTINIKEKSEFEKIIETITPSQKINKFINNNILELIVAGIGLIIFIILLSLLKREN